MKIQHLETLLLSTPSFVSIQEEIIQSFTIVVNSLYCLPVRDRWITVNKLNHGRSRNNTGKDRPVIKKKAKTSNNNSLEFIQRVVLTLAELQAEQKIYLDRKLKEVGKQRHFTGF
jgi:hypothetical protein